MTDPDSTLRINREAFTRLLENEREAGKEIGFKKAVNALLLYKPESEDVTACMHSAEWGIYLQKNEERILNNE